jgi:hypothetical protein
MKQYLRLDEDEVAHLHELALEHFQAGCYSCHTLRKKLEDFIGPRAVRRNNNTIKTHPYCTRETDQEKLKIKEIYEQDQKKMGHATVVHDRKKKKIQQGKNILV